MAIIRDTIDILVPVSNQLNGQIKDNLLLRPLPLSRAPTSPFLGSSNQCGSALATEIDSYRRRIQTLVHFVDCIAQHWWDHLYPYKRDLIKRPSRSADEIRSYRSRLVARLNKFTMRTVVPAAAAIAMMEAHASVKVLPPNLLSSLSTEMITDAPTTMDNSAALLNKACTLARRIGDIEKFKQRLILAVLTWITSDGRDFSLRNQRIALLARHAEPCLIEHFAGVRALLTHYYRPRVVTHKFAESHTTEVEATATKSSPANRTEPITAARLTSTNEQIASAIEQFYPRSRNLLAVQNTDSDEVSDERTSTLPFRQFNLEPVSRHDDLFSNPSSSIHVSQDTMPLTGNSQIPMLPSIVLNPLSVDTSQLDWLSYEVNQREFNLHVLNNEEPDDRPMLGRKSPVKVYGIRARPHQRPDSTLSSTVTKSHQLISLSVDKTPPQELAYSKPDARTMTLRTPIATKHSKEHIWPGSSHDSDVSIPDVSVQSSMDRRPSEAHRTDETKLGTGWISLHLSEEPTVSAITMSPLTAHGEEVVTPAATGLNEQSYTSTKESTIQQDKHHMTTASPTGKGEEPSSRTQTGSKPLPVNQLMTQPVSNKKIRASVHWRSAQKLNAYHMAQSIGNKARNQETQMAPRTRKSSNAAVPQLVPNHLVNTQQNRNQIPIKGTQLSSLRELKSSR